MLLIISTVFFPSQVISQIYSVSTKEKYHMFIYPLLKEKKKKGSKVITTNSVKKFKAWTYAKNNWEKKEQ